MALKENYKDDILDVSVNTKRKYRMTENQDGTVSLDDETVYTQEGDSFGASDMNAVNSEVNEVVNNLGAKNMLPNNATSQVVAGITYTINSDGSITISGTSTASNGIILSSNQLLHKGTYKTTTGQTQEEDADAFIYVQDTNTQRVISRSNDLEVPSQFTLANDTLVNYGVWVDVGKTVNVTIYPMVRPASIADDTYAPYAQTNKQLTDNLSGFKFYPTGTQLVALVADDSYYTDTNGKYVLADSTTGQSMIDNVTYKALASTEDCHGEVGADTASPFSSGVDLENISIQGVTANRSFTAIIGHKYLVSVVTYFTGSTYPSISGGTIINESSVYQTYRYVFLKTFLIVATSTTITCTLRGDTDVRDNCITYIDVTN